jgi:glycosyltransferase involved in cell wall biosynthesis
MADWFDFEAVDAMTKALPEVSFVLIGPEPMARKRLTSRPNLHLLGCRLNTEIPSYLHHADVGIIPFAVRHYGDLVRGINPLKLYEYLAAGLPVIATAWKELETLEAPITLCRTVQEHISAVRHAVSTVHDPAPGIAFASRFDWQPRVETLIDTLLAGIH